jgi:hypothetical protein
MIEPPSGTGDYPKEKKWRGRSIGKAEYPNAPKISPAQKIITPRTLKSLEI